MPQTLCRIDFCAMIIIEAHAGRLHCIPLRILRLQLVVVVAYGAENTPVDAENGGPQHISTMGDTK